jgi:hypothetical protein
MLDGFGMCVEGALANLMPEQSLMTEADDHALCARAV